MKFDIKSLYNEIGDVKKDVEALRADTRDMRNDIKSIFRQLMEFRVSWIAFIVFVAATNFWQEKNIALEVLKTHIKI